MIRQTIAFLFAIAFGTCTQLYSQDSSESQLDSVGSKQVIGMLNRIQESDETALLEMSALLKEIPPGAVVQGLRIKAAGQIGTRLLELQKTDAALAQLRYAISLPHDGGASAQACASMWSVAMDELALHLFNNGKPEQILPLLDKFAQHSDSICFQAIFAVKKAKWLSNTGDKDAANEYVRNFVVELFPIGPETAVYELDPIFQLVGRLSFRDRDLEKSALEQLAGAAEKAIRAGDSLPLAVFVNCRARLCANAIEESDTVVDISQYSKGVEELATLAIKHSSGENQKLVQERVEYLLSWLVTRMDKLKASQQLSPLVGEVVPSLDGMWITSAVDSSLEKLRGKVVVLDFWAIWCGPCIASFPEMQQLQDHYKEDGVVVVGVTKWYGYEWNVADERPSIVEQENEKSDHGSDDHAAEVSAIRRFLKEQKVSYAQLAISKEADAVFGIGGLPTIVIVDKKGVVRNVLTGGGDATHAKINRIVESLVAE